MTERLRAVPVWAWLALIVVGSAALRLWLVSGMAGPFIFVDELIYSELARSLAAGDGYSVRGLPTSGYSLLYPLLIAPAYALFDGLPDAYALAKSINAVAMSLAAVPAFLIARRVVRPSLALLAALTAVAVPSLAYTATLTTESLFYPVALLLRVAAPPLPRGAGLGTTRHAHGGTRGRPGNEGAVTGVPPGDRHRAAPPRALRTALARRQAVRSALRGPGRRHDSRRCGSGRTRARADGSPRCVQHRRRRRLRRRLGRPHGSVASPGADPLRGHPSDRCADHPPLALAWSRAAGPAASRGDRLAASLEHARRRHVRLTVRVRPHPGSLPLLPRPAARDRAARLGRGRSATAASRNVGRCRRRPGTTAALSLLALHQRAGEVRHGRAAAAVDDQPAPRARGVLGHGRPCRTRARAGLSPRACAGGGCSAARGAASVRRRFEAGLVGASGVSRRRSRSAVSGDPGSRARLDRSCRSRGTGGRRAVDRAGGSVHREPERVLQQARRQRSTTPAPRRPGVSTRRRSRVFRTPEPEGSAAVSSSCQRTA